MLSFSELFFELTGHPPFPWQARLFSEFANADLRKDDFRKSCDVPTGLGKTSVIAIWLLALAHRAGRGDHQGFPRRLIYVVNRRTVVDQATREAEGLRKALTTKPGLEPLAASLRSLGSGFSETALAISTLRGEFADNAEWRSDPAQPAIIVGTVDMIGSRVLFAGYGCGFKSKPLHAGLLGQNSLLVHDEAHLEPAFQRLVETIESEQRNHREFRPVRVMQLTATARPSGSVESILSDADRAHPEALKRLRAKKAIEFVDVGDRNTVSQKIVECALRYKDSGNAILLFLRELKQLEEVCNALKKNGLEGRLQRLTGTMRGFEREAMLKDNPIFARASKQRSKDTNDKD